MIYMICVYQFSYRLLTHLVCICVEACAFSTEYVFYIKHACIYVYLKRKTTKKQKAYV